MKNILMNTEMTKAILDGRKTQTRRVGITNHGRYIIDDNLLKSYKLANQDILKCGKYKKGDIIWVREPAKVIDVRINIDNIGGEAYMDYIYSDGTKGTMQIPERFNVANRNYFPQWIRIRGGVPNGCIKEMARIFLKITDVRVEKLQDISVSDIEKEGIAFDTGRLEKYCNTDDEFNDNVCEEFFERWIECWNKTAQKGYKWEDNPYVFVYDFERVLKRTER